MGRRSSNGGCLEQTVGCLVWILLALFGIAYCSGPSDKNGTSTTASPPPSSTRNSISSPPPTQLNPSTPKYQEPRSDSQVMDIPDEIQDLIAEVDGGRKVKINKSALLQLPSNPECRLADLPRNEVRNGAYQGIYCLDPETLKYVRIDK